MEKLPQTSTKEEETVTLCKYCNRQHAIQAFISHSSSDELLAKEIQKYCCQADVRPILFEMFPGSLESASKQIIEEVMKSDVHFIILGPEVAKRSWTQAWIGFEIGISSAQSINKQNKQPQNYYNIHKLFLIEDITQDYDASTPDLEFVLLLDFADKDSWQSITTLLKLINPNVPSDVQLWEDSNNLRLTKLIILKCFKCPNPKCEHTQEILIWMGPRVKRNLLQIPDPPKQFSLKCSACRSFVNITLLQSLQGPPNWVAKTSLPKPNEFPLSHISRLA